MKVYLGNQLVEGVEELKCMYPVGQSYENNLQNEGRLENFRQASIVLRVSIRQSRIIRNRNSHAMVNEMHLPDGDSIRDE